MAHRDGRQLEGSTQPSVTSSSADTSAADKASPITSPRKAVASSVVKRRSAALISVIWLRARSLERGRGGSMRPETTRCAFSDRCSSRKEVASWTGSELIRW